jgi:hypothetical protein
MGSGIVVGELLAAGALYFIAKIPTIVPARAKA